MASRSHIARSTPSSRSSSPARAGAGGSSGRKPARAARAKKEYKCLECSAGPFLKWGQCLAHLRAEGHGDPLTNTYPTTKEGRRALQSLCVLTATTPNSPSLEPSSCEPPATLVPLLPYDAGQKPTQIKATSIIRRRARGLSGGSVGSTKSADNADVERPDKYSCFYCGARFKRWDIVMSHFSLSPSCMSEGDPHALSEVEIKALRRACAVGVGGLRPKDVAGPKRSPSTRVRALKNRMGSSGTSRGSGDSHHSALADLPERVVAYLNLFLTVEETFYLYEALAPRRGMTIKSERAYSRVSGTSSGGSSAPLSAT